MIKHIDFPIEETNTDWGSKAPITEYTVILTEDCNLRCSYCYVNKDPIKMNEKTAAQTIKFICNNANLYGNSRIDLFGGEPLLNQEMMYYFIKETNSYNETHKNKITITIFTNGILLNQDILNFTKKYDHVSYSMSQDGCQQCHDKSRKYADGTGSFNDVIKASNEYEYVYGCELIKKFMISPDNMEYLPDSIHYMLDNHIYRMSLSIIRDDIWNEENIAKLKEILYICADLYMANIDKLWIDLFAIPVIDYTYSSTRYCSAGRSMVGISPDGGIYPCQRFYNIDRSVYRIGDVFKGINNEDKNYLLFSNFRVDRNLLECKKCDTFKSFNCTGQCMAACYSVNKTIFKLIPSVCNVLKLLYEVSNEIYIKMKDNPYYIKTLDKNRYGG